MVALLCTLAGSAFLIAPTAFHRIRFRDRDKEALLRISNVFAIGGLVFLAIAMTASVFLITDLLFKDSVTAIVTSLTAALFALVWFVLPLAPQVLPSEELGRRLAAQDRREPRRRRCCRPRRCRRASARRAPAPRAPPPPRARPHLRRSPVRARRAAAPRRRSRRATTV